MESRTAGFGRFDSITFLRAVVPHDVQDPVSPRFPADHGRSRGHRGHPSPSAVQGSCAGKSCVEPTMPSDRGEGEGVTGVQQPWIGFESPGLQNPFFRLEWALRAQKEVIVNVSLGPGMVAEGDHSARGAFLAGPGGG